MHRATALILAAIPTALLAQTRPHPYDLIDVKWQVTLHENTASLNGDIVNTVVPKAGTKEIWFDRGELSVSRALVDGAATSFRIAGEKVYVTLPPNKRKGQVKVRVLYSGKPGAGIYFVPAKRAFPATTPVIYTQGEMEDNRFWLVTYDYPDDKATSEGFITVPSDYTTYSNGRLIGVTPSGNRSTWHWKMDRPHVTYLISLVAGPYDTGHEEWGGIPVMFGVPKGLMEMGQTSFGGTADMIRVYSEITGFKYPYPKFSQEAVPDYMFGGMENITAVTQTIGALHPKSVDAIASSQGLVLHELAHQWFGDTVTCSGWSDAWINEGWATFMPSFYLRATEGQDAYDLSRYDTFQGGLGSSQADPTRPVVWKGYKDPLDMFSGLIYPGGASRMFMLMNILGEAEFWRCCKQYLEERKFTSFDTKAFFQTWSRASGKDLTPFMNQWFYTAGAPNLTAKWSGSDVIITQPKPYFDFEVPVWVLDSGNWVKGTTHLSGAEARVSFPGRAGKPFLVDPEVWLMANIKYSDSWPSVTQIALFNAAPNVASKARALDTWLRGLPAAEALSFAKTIQSKELLGRYISSVRDTPGAESYLIELANGTDETIAASAVAQLGSMPASASVKSTLTKIFESHPNVLIRQTAARNLLNATSDKALADRLWRMPSYNDGFRAIALAWWFDHDKPKARDIALQTLANPPSEPVRVDAIGYLGRLKDAPGKHLVFNALKRIVANENSFGARNTAISALANYGDKAAIPTIKPLLRAPLVFFRQTAANAIEQLNRG